MTDADDKPPLPDLPSGRAPHKRPPAVPPLTELIELRQKKYPKMLQRVFAKEYLGITRLHMTSVEVGRRRPSLELALRWVQALAPEARMDMFGPLPIVEEQIRQIKRLQKIAPEIFAGA